MNDEELRSRLASLRLVEPDPTTAARVRARVIQRTLDRTRRLLLGRSLWAAASAAALIALWWIVAADPPPPLSIDAAMRPPRPPEHLLSTRRRARQSAEHAPSRTAAGPARPQIRVADDVPTSGDDEGGSSGVQTLEIVSSNPNVVIYWLVEPNGD